MGFEIEPESSVKLLAVQQDRMARDISEINKALTKVAESLSNLAVLEQKHTDSLDAIKRAHSRIDTLEGTIKEESKGHEKRIQDLELHNARNVWIERLFMVIIVGIISLWIEGGV